LGLFTPGIEPEPPERMSEHASERLTVSPSELASHLSSLLFLPVTENRCV
jgi:hypothetical protein